MDRKHSLRARERDTYKHPVHIYTDNKGKGQKMMKMLHFSWNWKEEGAVLTTCDKSRHYGNYKHRYYHWVFCYLWLNNRIYSGKMFLSFLRNILDCLRKKNISGTEIQMCIPINSFYKFYSYGENPLLFVPCLCRHIHSHRPLDAT